MAFCVFCGNKIEDDQLFCGYCGADLSVLRKRIEEAETGNMNKSVNDFDYSKSYDNAMYKNDNKLYGNNEIYSNTKQNNNHTNTYDSRYINNKKVSTQKNKKRATRKHKTNRLLVSLFCFAILVAVVMLFLYPKSTYYQHKKYLKRQEEIKKSGAYYCNSVSIDGGNIVITQSGNDILNQLDEYQISNQFSFNDEYEYVDSGITSKGNVYMFRQMHNDIPVLGSEIDVFTDENHNLLNILGCHIDNELFVGSNKLSIEEAINRVSQYVSDKLGVNQTDLELENIGNYYIRYNDALVLSYILKCSYIGTEDIDYIGNAIVTVNSDDGSVLYENSDIQAGMETVNKEGQDGNQTFDALHENKKYYLWDEKRNIKLINQNGNFNYNEEGVTELNEKLENKEFSPYWTEVGGVENDIDKSSVDAMANTQRAYDFYDSVFGRKGMKNDPESDIVILTNVRNYIPVGGNTESVTNNLFSVSGQIIIAGKGNVIDNHGTDNNFGLIRIKDGETLTKYLDLVGHEFTHGVVYTDCSAKNEGANTFDFDAINEGIADILGEMVEDYSDDKLLNGTNDWKICNGVRKLSKDYNIKKFNSESKKNRDEHNASHIVTRATWLMHDGINGTNEKKLNNEQIAYMYYDLIPRLKPTNNIQEMRTSFENLIYNPGENGNHYNFSNNQIDCIMDAFDAVGIENNYCNCKMLTDGKLYIKNSENKQIENYNIKITNPSKEIFYEATSVDGRNAIDLKEVGLNSGIYDFIISVDNNTYTYRIAVNNDNKNTKYVSKYESSQTIFLEDDQNNDKSDSTTAITSIEKNKIPMSPNVIDTTWQPLDISKLPEYVEGGATLEVMEEFMAFFPVYEGNQTVSDGFSGEQAFSTMENSLVDVVEELWIKNTKRKINYVNPDGTNAEMSTNRYKIKDVANSILFFTDLTLDEKNINELNEKYSRSSVEMGYMIEAVGDELDVFPKQGDWGAFTKIESAETNGNEIKLHYKHWYETEREDASTNWVAYMRKTDDEKYRIYKVVSADEDEGDKLSDKADDNSADKTNSSSDFFDRTYDNWKDAYIEFLNGFEVTLGNNNNAHAENKNARIKREDDYEDYASISYGNVGRSGIDFLYIDDDKIPEMILKDDWTSYIISFYDGKLYASSVGTKYEFNVSEKNGVLTVAGGTGWHNDVLEKLENGKLESVAAGIRDSTQKGPSGQVGEVSYYYLNKDGNLVEESDQYTKYQVDESEYNGFWDSVKERYGFKEPERTMSIEEAIEYIKGL